MPLYRKTDRLVLSAISISICELQSLSLAPCHCSAVEFYSDSLDYPIRIPPPAKFLIVYTKLNNLKKRHIVKLRHANVQTSRNLPSCSESRKYE